MIERMNQGTSRIKKRTTEIYEAPFGSFETDVVPELYCEDIGDDDRAFVFTKSGNRYMIRHSKSRGESLVIYDEREGGFSAEGAHSFMVRKEAGEKGPVARVGGHLNVLTTGKDDTSDRSEWTSTTVNRIEIRRGIEAAIREIVASREDNSDSESIFRGIARAAGAMGGARSDIEEEIDPLDPKYKS